MPASSSANSSSSSSWIHLRSVLHVVASSSPAYCSSSFSLNRAHIKSPWSRKRKKHALSLQQWRSFFDKNGRLSDGGMRLLKKVRYAGVHPSIRSEVWPFLLGVYDLDSTMAQRERCRVEKRREYERLRRYCVKLGRLCRVEADEYFTTQDSKSIAESPFDYESQHIDSPSTDDAISAGESFPDNESQGVEFMIDSPSYEDTVAGEEFFSPNRSQCIDFSAPYVPSVADVNFIHVIESQHVDFIEEMDGFSTWLRIIRLDAVRAEPEAVEEPVSEARARRSATAIGLREYGQLAPWRVLHSARLVAILEAYAAYDPEIGYCQGMTDLLSPIVSVIKEDHSAFWCFVGFMRMARDNFRVDGSGIRRQLTLVSWIIKCRDSHLYRHLERLRAEECLFVYRMVVVMFRRELDPDQTLCLWEAIWSDRVAVLAGLLGRRQVDLLLYAVAAAVLQMRKAIMECESAEDILRECNSMSGGFDVWKLLEDAHELVAALHGKSVVDL